MSGTEVLVVGDANPDLVLRGDVVPRFGQEEQLLTDLSCVLGGSAAITAAGLSALGIAVSIGAVVADDLFGRFVASELAALGVDTAQLRTSREAPTGASIILSAEDRAILTLPGTIPTLTVEDVLAACTDAMPKWVHISSLFLQPQLASALPDVLPAMRIAGVQVSLDTNWDPTGKWDGVRNILPYVDVLFPNLPELRAISAAMGITGPDSHRATALAGMGPRVVVKAGAEGAWSVDSQGTRTDAPSIRVDVVDTTGAGDSFNAGYIAAALRGVTEESERLRWATTAGGLSIRAAGGTATQATRADLVHAGLLSLT